MNEKTEQNLVEKILVNCDNSTTVLAHRLTEHTRKLYVPQLVNYWRAKGFIPPQHCVAVSEVTGIPVEEICPEVYAQYNEAKNRGRNI